MTDSLFPTTVSNEPIFEIPFEERATRPTGAYWLPLNKGIVITCADGSVKTFDTKVEEAAKSSVKRLLWPIQLFGVVAVC